LMMISTMLSLLITIGRLENVCGQIGTSAITAVVPPVKKTNWTSFIFGSIAGIIPWIVIFLFFFGSVSGDAKPPTFVYVINPTLFVFFNIFAINMVLQYKKVGPWKDYLFGERAYIILSLVSKSILAWLIFAGTLAPV